MAVELKETIDRRREEIMDACERLYDIKGFHGITIKDISTETSFSRPSIYNYFRTKEEIFLGILTREYAKWNDSMRQLLSENKLSEKDSLAKSIASSLDERKVLLKISAQNLYEIEDNSRLELLKEFKLVFKDSINLFDECLSTCIENKEKRNHIRYSFFPYMYGIYPYAYPTEKQIIAMDEVELPHEDMSIYDLTYQFLVTVLGI